MNQYLGELLNLIAKILTLSIRPSLEKQKTKILTTDKMIAAYMACDGRNSIPQIVEAAGYTSPTSVEDNLPKWESLGLSLSVGYGFSKRYLAIENIPLYLVHLKSLPISKESGSDE